MTYQILYIDPPKDYPKSGGITNSRGLAKKFYDTMTDDEIIQYINDTPIAENCAMFIWSTFPNLQSIFKIIKETGFEYFGLAFLWIKKTKHMKDFVGMGYVTRANPEPCFLAIKGKMKPLRHDVRQLVYAQVGEHSEKPDIIRDKIVHLYGDLPRKELFATKEVNGWDNDFLISLSHWRTTLRRDC